MPETWVDPVIRKLRNRNLCPRCGGGLAGPVCGSCGADLQGPLAWSILQASEDAAVALEARQALVQRLTEASPATGATAVVTATAPSTPVAVQSTPAAAAPATKPATASSGVSLQSILAVVGAGLVAIAAIVFTFFNPDLDSFEIRTAIVAGFTLLFFGAAWLLARARLRFSAEAVGSLGTVFVALDVWAVTEPVDDLSTKLLVAAGAVAVASALLLSFGALVVLRSPVWIGTVTATLVPLLIGSSIGTSAGSMWGVPFGLVGAAAVPLLAYLVHPALARRFGSTLRADATTGLVLQLFAIGAVLVLLLANDTMGVERSTGSGLSLLLLAAIAGLSARFAANDWWSWLTGALLALSASAFSTIVVTDGAWIFALIAGAAVVVVALSALLPQTPHLDRWMLRLGAWTISLIWSVPAALSLLPVVLFGVLFRGGEADPGMFGGAELALPLALSLGAGAIAAILLRAVWRRAQQVDPIARYFLPVAAWHIAAAIVYVATWTWFSDLARVVIALGVASALGVVLSFVKRARSLRAGIRMPFVVAAHVLVVLAAIIAWQDESLRVGGGAAGLAVIVLLARLVPGPIRPAYTAVGYGWALVVLSAGLALTGLDVIAVLCLTTSTAAVAALIATVAPWPRTAHWYAILAVTSVPFLIGVATVFVERSGWTGLSTSVIVALLIVILLGRREGLTGALRTIAAALVVPATAVAIISLGAHFLTVSASPVTLPVIAAIIACVLPATRLIGGALEIRGVAAAHARASRIALEVSSLVTAVFAIVLALVRAAAGLPTTLIVLIILGSGAIATAVFGGRRYGWPVAGASFTGALWSIWALNGVTGLEPYLLPPTLGAAAVGLFLVVRGLPGFVLSARGLYAAGLATAVAPVLVALAAVGSNGITPWRAWLLLGIATVLVLFAGLTPRIARIGAFEQLPHVRVPSLVIALLASSGGVIQSVRFALGYDGVGMDGMPMPTVLLYTGASTVIAIAAGALLAAPSNGVSVPDAARRWVLVPALTFATVGPVAARGDDWFSIITLLLLSLTLLAIMIVTVVRGLTRPVILPPVVITFALAWSAAVASWSARELRVEAYSLPMGAALIAAGVIASRASRDNKATFWSWPLGFTRSWALYTPGLVVTFLPSILATGTDPRTERAVLVIVLALVAIMIGNLRRLAAPFILGIIVLPIENLVVFTVQIGQNIGAQPWWITLATAGAVLLVLAVTSERRVGQGKGAAARMRDLR
ncbi:hypothetical protein M2152_001285 [Microbacteriaceae bacterium SG_E_30_P1]|uniref:DUF2157 domain-containing protein n=1 Tax=Antiquaquibacter oligotrophicus TaxID=2880260 RepID=A0ABT6KNS8_9MICO|nr:hypothetical protein [Antiquaquibacter oligotrophicus]MDH6181103.1 hypothetical protein [Antiquaquibacter oligotrophicus]UDF13199.1 hypothetical protein LH407_13725 [Antiquaquibacter oligotrophicus]